MKPGLVLCGWLVALALLGGMTQAGEKEPEKPRRPLELGPDGLPKYRHPYHDGLYSTVTAMSMFWVPELTKRQKLKLKVPGFRKDFPVYAMFQDAKTPAPLIVVLLGVDGKVDGPWGDLFSYWYSEAGCHVVTFDSPFTPAYSEIAGQGVVGNFDAETDQVAAIVETFLKTEQLKDRVSGIGVVGMSFGATQALLLAAKAQAGKLNFKLDGCLALSPPVSLRASARIIDRFFAEDRWDTTMIELGKRFGSQPPVAADQKIPFSATEMRAAIGFVFRDGLAEVVERNDRFHKLKVIPAEGEGVNRKSYAEATGFERFIEAFTFPYWEKKGTVKSADELWDMCELKKILPRLPDNATAVIAADDPFNTAEDLVAAQAADSGHALIVLPNGGHLGFAAADWTLAKALRIFVPRRAAPAPTEPEDTK